MDVYFQLREQRFVWDANKAATNFARHGISFQLAAEVLLDPLVAFIEADAHGESRQAAVGETLSELLLFVVNIERDDRIIRIISARKATKSEKRIYDNRK